MNKGLYFAILVPFLYGFAASVAVKLCTGTGVRISKAEARVLPYRMFMDAALAMIMYQWFIFMNG